MSKIYLNRMISMSVSTIMMLGLSACATTNVVKMSEAAPITYKMGQGGAQYASLTLPKTQQRASRSNRSYISPAVPRVAEPRVAAPRLPAPSVDLGPEFDPSERDSTLYAHQLVGKKYKIAGKSYTPKHEPSYDESGIASWYGEKFHGRPTATGEIYNMNAFTAAHKTLPLNSMLHVENLENGHSLIVRLNDRGPFVGDRIIDLSKRSAQALGVTDGGLARVRVRYIGPADPNLSQSLQSKPPAYDVTPPKVVDAPVMDEITPCPTHYVVKANFGYDSFGNPCLPSEPAQPATPNVSLDYFDIPQAREEAPTYNPVVPMAPMPAPGEALPEEGGQITLTIKGPIHIAKSDDKDAKPKLIRSIERHEIK